MEEIDLMGWKTDCNLVWPVFLAIWAAYQNKYSLAQDMDWLEARLGSAGGHSDAGLRTLCDWGFGATVAPQIQYNVN